MWEYAEVNIPFALSKREIYLNDVEVHYPSRFAFLDAIGAEGWEAVSGVGNSDSRTYLFKRTPAVSDPNDTLNTNEEIILRAIPDESKKSPDGWVDHYVFSSKLSMTYSPQLLQFMKHLAQWGYIILDENKGNLVLLKPKGMLWFAKDREARATKNR